VATTTSIGRTAETVAANYLEQQSFKILQQNWRTRWCEIDLVVTKANTIYFVEVKYRSSSVYGAGLDYITPKKLNQMRFAADFWLAKYNWRGDIAISAIELSGPHFNIDNFISEITG